MSQKFEIIENGSGGFRIRFTYSREVIFAIGSYDSRSRARRALESMTRHLPPAGIVEAA